MGQYYGFLLSRYVKFNTDPGTWDPVGIKLLNKFNTWRKSPRIRAMTEEITRPLHAGPNFDPVDGPYAWMYTSERKDRALLIATAAMRDAPDTFAPKVCWLDPQKTYLIEDISMEADRYQYKFIGRFTGAELRSEGFRSTSRRTPPEVRPTGSRKIVARHGKSSTPTNMCVATAKRSKAAG